MIAKSSLRFPALVGGSDTVGERVDWISPGHVAVETPLVAECLVVSTLSSPLLLAPNSSYAFLGQSRRLLVFSSHSPHSGTSPHSSGADQTHSDITVCRFGATTPRHPASQTPLVATSSGVLHRFFHVSH